MESSNPTTLWPRLLPQQQHWEEQKPKLTMLLL
jgi:hypothetical protein